MIDLWVSLLAAGVVGAGIKVHDYIEAETLVYDLFDEFRLSRASLNALDEACLANPRRSNAIVSLTTIPSRLPLIGLTLKSLMRQRVAPSRIVLNLPRFSRRENVAYEVPDFLRNLRSVQVRWCEDLGPATKLLPSLMGEDADTRIIVVDDDRVYPANLVEDLVAAADRQPNTVFSMRGWVVPQDLTDRPTTLRRKLSLAPDAPTPVRALRIAKPARVDVIMGVAGYLVQPSFFDLDAIMDYSNAPREAFFVDDVWISAHLKVPRFVIPSSHVSYQPKQFKGIFDRTALSEINNGPGVDELRNNTIVMRYFSDRWMTTSATDVTPTSPQER